MSLFALKIIATVFMVIDHIGILFFPQTILFRAVGRLAFPIFAFTVANAFHHTKSRRTYLVRMLFLAALCQIPYGLLYHGLTLNIFFTLGFGFGIVWLYQGIAKGNTFSFPGILLVTGLILFFAWGDHTLFTLQYGGFGLALIFLFHLFYRRKWKTALAQILLLAVTAPVNIFFFQQDISWSLLSLCSALALPLILSYNGNKGRSWKYFFYLFYPLHLLFLQGLYYLLQAW